MTCMEKVGYVAAFLKPASRDALHAWAGQHIPADKRYHTITNDIEEGGVVTHKAHCTLFFGLQEHAVNAHEMEAHLATLHLETLQVDGVALWHTPNPDCNIVVLTIADPDKALLQIHESFKKFPHDTDDTTRHFQPHVTIAYVQSDFDSAPIRTALPRTLDIATISYKTTYKIQFN